MRQFAKLIYSLLLIATPVFFLDARLPSFADVSAPTLEPCAPAFDRPYSYDEMIQLLDAVESGALEERCDEQDTEKVAQFLAMLACNGAPSEDDAHLSALQEDLASLFSPLIDASTVHPASFGKVIVCKSWAKKRWDGIRKFTKKHKKELIIGVVVLAVVTIAVITASTSVAIAGAGAAAGAAAANDPNSSDAALSPTLSNQIADVKENIASQNFFSSDGSGDCLSMAETGRAIGSVFAHDSYAKLQESLNSNPTLWRELKDLHVNYANNPYPISYGHTGIDSAFATHLSPISELPIDINAKAHLATAESAVRLGYYDQAVYNFSRSIDCEPSFGPTFLERGSAYFQLGEYERAIADYQSYAKRAPQQAPFSTFEFSKGFAKGLPKGVYESGSGLFLLVSDLIVHPLDTSGQIYDSFAQLSQLVRSAEWETLGHCLSPELHQLIVEWDSLPSERKGELAGYAFGKHGADILIPGAVAKVAAKGLKGAQQLNLVYRELQLAEQTLLLETAAKGGGALDVAEIISANKNAISLGEELGFTTQEIGQLKQAGELKTVTTRAYEQLSPQMRESYTLFKNAEEFLQKQIGFLSESQAKELIHQTGITTFPRPPGMPEQFRVRLSNSGAGLMYMHPDHTHVSVRVMPGKPHSPFPYQQKPYIIHMKNGKALDKHGNAVAKNSPDAHIPYDEFVYRD